MLEFSLDKPIVTKEEIDQEITKIRRKQNFVTVLSLLLLFIFVVSFLVSLFSPYQFFIISIFSLMWFMFFAAFSPAYLDQQDFYLDELKPITDYRFLICYCERFKELDKYRLAVLNEKNREFVVAEANMFKKWVADKEKSENKIANPFFSENPLYIDVKTNNLS